MVGTTGFPNSGRAAHSLSLVALRDARVGAMSRQQCGTQGMRLTAHPAARGTLDDVVVNGWEKRTWREGLK